MDAWKIPVFVVGVVEAGARGVAEQPGADGNRRTIAVLATVGTCSSQAYPRAIQKAAGQAGRLQPVVIQQGSVGIAAAIESDPAFVNPTGLPGHSSPKYQGPSVVHQSAKIQLNRFGDYQFDPAGLIGDRDRPESLQLNSTENYIRYDVATLVQSYKESGATNPIDTVVLGCTHFPLVEKEILAAFESLRTLERDGQTPYSALISRKISVVDPARLTARELFQELARKRLRRLPSSDKTGLSDAATTAIADHAAERDQFFLSVANAQCDGIGLAPDGTLEYDYKYGRQPGNLHTEDTICVPMSLELLPPASVTLIQTRLPAVWSRLKEFSTP